MADRRYFVDIFGDIVTEVRKDFDPTNLVAPNYMYGHIREIAKRLDLKEREQITEFEKFPLVALIQDFTETHGEILTHDYTLPVTVVIVTGTDRNYISEERYANTFKTTLYPIYELLLEKISKSPDLIAVNKKLIPHDKTDRLFWGSESLYSNDKLIFNDYLDAIELNFDGLTVPKVNNRKCL